MMMTQKSDKLAQPTGESFRGAAGQTKDELPGEHTLCAPPAAHSACTDQASAVRCTEAERLDAKKRARKAPDMHLRMHLQTPSGPMVRQPPGCRAPHIRRQNASAESRCAAAHDQASALPPSHAARAPQEGCQELHQIRSPSDMRSAYVPLRRELRHGQHARRLCWLAAPVQQVASPAWQACRSSEASSSTCAPTKSRCRACCPCCWRCRSSAHWMDSWPCPPLPGAAMLQVQPAHRCLL